MTRDWVSHREGEPEGLGFIRGVMIAGGTMLTLCGCVAVLLVLNAIGGNL